MTIRAYKLRLYPNAAQRMMLERYFGSARWVWNRAMEYRSKAYRRRGESLSAVDFSRLLTRLKRTARYGWLRETPSVVLQQKLRDQDRAFTNFFAGRARYPRFRKRGNAEAIRFTIDARHVGKVAAWTARRVVVAGIGEVRYRGGNHPGQVPKRVTVRRDACGHYYASFTVEVEMSVKPLAGKAVGVDVGLKDLATLSDGTHIEHPKHLKGQLKRLRHAGRALSRRRKGSRRWHAARRRVARLHQRIRNARSDALHKLTTGLVDENQVICLEDLNVSGMVKNHHLAQAIADSGFGELRRQLTYKAQWYGRTLIVVDRWYPSSKTCSCCGHVLEALSLSIRHWTCPACSAEHERDENAARNILAEGLRQQVPGGTGELMRVEGKSADRLVAAGETRPRETRIVHSREAASGTPANG